MRKSISSTSLTCCVLLLLLGTHADDNEQCVTPQGITNAVNSFGVDMFLTIKRDTTASNTVFSPLSISTAGAFLSLLANGDTKNEVDTVFKFTMDMPQELIKSQDIRNTNSSNILALVNGLFLQSDFDVKQEFKERFERLLQRVDFGMTEVARSTINGWIETATQGHIPDMLPKNTLAAEAKLVLANAVYFQGLWQYAFNKDATSLRMFKGLNGGKEAMFMHHSDVKFRWKNDEELGIQILELPYEGDRFGMFFVLPNADNPGSPTELVQQIAGRGVTAVLTEDFRNSTFSTVSIPKFEIETSVELDEALRTLGVNLVFDPNDADLSGLSEEKLHIDKGLHRAKIIVDESGTEAAAATTGTVLPLSAQTTADRTFIADRPFVYFVLDKLDCAVLFMGSVESLQ